MTSSFSGGQPAPVPTSSARKAPRDRLACLGIDADLCPQILLRVLGLIAQHGLVPLSIDYRCDDDGLRIDIVIDGLAEGAAQTLLHRIRGLVTVRSAEFACVPVIKAGDA